MSLRKIADGGLRFAGRTLSMWGRTSVGLMTPVRSQSSLPATLTTACINFCSSLRLLLPMIESSTDKSAGSLSTRATVAVTILCCWPISASGVVTGSTAMLLRMAAVAVMEDGNVGGRSGFNVLRSDLMLVGNNSTKLSGKTPILIRKAIRLHCRFV